ncbi:MAG: methyltransferase domain-containing protein [Proteobacteria bacterium]|nr:methyltransferase domain-containing protein [Pseudomonadota bacterium]
MWVQNESFELELFANIDREFEAHFETDANSKHKYHEPPLYGTLWPSAEGLAAALTQRDLNALSVLEIGCGLGLPSLVSAQRGAQVSCMDHHPEVEALLQRNCQRNKIQPLNFICSSFTDTTQDLGLFDLIIGSDILYEPESYATLEGFILRHIKDTGEVLIADPGRFAVARFGQKIKQLSHYQKYTQTIPGDRAAIELHHFRLQKARSLQEA